jgi:ATP-dependent RNA helicase RhlE
VTNFTALGLAAPLLRALAEEKYETPTPIQAEAIPPILAGRDLQGIAQTGTGKTAAFALPILHRLAGDRRPAPRGGARVLVLSPTRELASQIAESFRVYGRHVGVSVATVFGGVSAGPQIRALQRGVDVLVATPGRLIDHLGERHARLDGVEIFVLDEADQMLDMGFIEPIRRIVRHLPARRQNLFFSATMPDAIGRLAGELLRDPARVAVTPVATTVERIDQQVVFVDMSEKRALLAEILRGQPDGRTLVFTRTKHGADKVTRHLEQAGIGADAIHGNKSQNQRERALASFRAGRTRVLVATDIAARGIDVDGITHVINFDLPNVPESYVHRIGRTARAGAAGIAISFCAGEERDYLRDIERLIRKRIAVSDRRAPRGEARRSEPRPHDERRDFRRDGDQRRDGDRRHDGERRPDGERSGQDRHRPGGFRHRRFGRGGGADRHGGGRHGGGREAVWSNRP